MNWQQIFQQSPVNGGVYNGEELVQRVFKPATNTWFQKRLDHVRAELKKEMLQNPNRPIQDN
jgi:AraC-like DNA-binding protein